MTKVHVYKDNDGRLRGVSAEDERNQKRWRKFIDSLAPGEQAEYEFTIPRDPKQSARFMATVRLLLARGLWPADVPVPDLRRFDA